MDLSPNAYYRGFYGLEFTNFKLPVHHPVFSAILTRERTFVASSLILWMMKPPSKLESTFKGKALSSRIDPHLEGRQN